MSIKHNFNKNKECIILSLIFIIIVIYNSLYLIGCFPGNFTPDSVNQLSQIVSSEYSDAHTPLSTLFYKIPYEIFGTMEGMIFFQQIFFAIVSIYGLKILLKYCKYKKIISTIFILFILFPTNALMLTNMWKDIPYAISVMLLTIIALQIVIDKSWLSNKWHCILFIIANLLVALFRHNGIIVMLGTLILLFFFNRDIKKNIKIVALTIIVFMVSKFAMTKIFNIQKTQSKSDVISIPLQQIAGIITENGTLEEKDIEVLEKIAPLEVWREKYNPYLSDNIKNLVNDYLQKNNEIDRVDIIKVYINMVGNNFKLATKAYLKQTSILWKINDYPKGALTYYTIEPNVLGQQKEIKSEFLNKVYIKILKESTSNPAAITIFWSPAMIMYIVIIFIIIYMVITKNIKILFLIAPMFANISSLMISIPAQDYRYVYSNLLVSVIVIPFIIDQIVNKYNENKTISNSTN